MADYIEHYIKMTQEANRVLALKAEEVGSELKDVAEDTVDTIGMGVKRLTWRTSYFFDGYRDVYDQIHHEDKRMASAIWNIVKQRKNVILEITQLFVDELLKEQNEKARERIYLELLKFSTKFATSKATKFAISIAIAEVLYQSLIINVVVRNNVRKYANYSLAAFQIYGDVEKAAVSADKLKRECPLFYWVLYSKKLEMLYFLVEPALSKGVPLIGKKCNENDIVSAFIEMMN
ncbi:hypothetical protein GEA64_18770 [Photorhabdus khanii]|uniref:Uncharacterized protein n=1 Tax=Photorhabdus khanii TaxID=1004150 RepID=A0A7C9GLR9_9GAMM|nr:hypothetical protein [Photorhabdus khanii]MQL49877.1 hypothetical protein [Photorhabdus khanii]